LNAWTGSLISIDKNESSVDVDESKSKFLVFDLDSQGEIAILFWLTDMLELTGRVENGEVLVTETPPLERTWW